jgi:hypothetical protein
MIRGKPVMAEHKTTLFFDTGEGGRHMSVDAHVEGESETREGAEACIARALDAMRQVKRRGNIDPEVIKRAAKGDA